MKSFLQLLPLILLIVVAVYFVMRGSRTEDDPDKNKSNIGGGPGDGGGVD